MDRPEAGYVDAVLQIAAKANRKASNEAEKEITARNKVEAIGNAMKKLNMSKEDACKLMDTTLEEYDTYQNLAQKAAGRRKKNRRAASK